MVGRDTSEYRHVQTGISTDLHVGETSRGLMRSGSNHCNGQNQADTVFGWAARVPSIPHTRQHTSTLFHDHKQVFISLGIREHFNIPKFHSLLHYMDCIKMYGTTDNYNTKAFERLHIDLSKDGWRASNTRNAIPQMTKWLERQEKIEMFRQYMD